MHRPIAISLSLFASGCGASTVRLAVGPTVDTAGRAGVEATVSLGIGTPLDFSQRSLHYLQALGALGGGVETTSRSCALLARADLSYIYWALPRLDLRAGAGYSYREVKSGQGLRRWHAAGGHLGIVPVVHEWRSNWLPVQFAVGAELRTDWLFDDHGDVHALFSVPLLAEVNFLAAGD